MSVQDAKVFLKKLAEDPGFRAQVESVDDAGKQQIADSLGLSFTKEEIESLAPQVADEELSDEDLEAVAGGKSAPWTGAAASAAGAAAAAAA